MNEYAVMPLSDYVDICDTIRGHLKINDKLTSDAIPPKIDEVFRQGASEAYAPAYDKGYADKSAEYNQLARDFSGIVYGEQKNEAIENVVNTAITDIGDTKVALEEKGIDTNGIPTSALPEKINEVYERGNVAGNLQGRNDYAEELLPYNHDLQQAVFGTPTGRPIEEVTGQATTDLNAIKGKIEEKGVDIPSLTPSSSYPEKIEEVYEKGYEKGKAEFDYDAAFEEGKKAQYDEFCDSYYDYGKRESFENAFAGEGWTNDIIPLKYDIKPKTAYMMFRGTRISGDLKALFESRNVVFDTSNCVNFAYMFNLARSITKVGVLDLSSVPIPPQSNTDAMFNNANALEEIELIRTSNEVFPQFGRTAFHNLNSLVKIRFEGVIADDISFAHSPLLDEESRQNIIGCLADLTGGTAKTLTFHSDVVASLTTEQLTSIANKNWRLG